jgi:membrane protein
MDSHRLSQWIRTSRERVLSAYRKLVIESGFPGAARNPVLFTGFLIREVLVKECSTRAMALSYQFLFCLVPALTLLLAFLAMLPGLEAARDQLVQLVVREFWLADSDAMTGHVESFIAKAEVFSLVGIAILVYGAVVLISTLHGAINAIWNIRPSQVSWLQRLGPLGLVASLIGGAVVLGIVTSDPFQSVLSFLDQSPLFTSGVRSFVTGLIAGWALTFLLYKLVPSTWVHTGSAAIASGVTSLLFSLAKLGFLYYAGLSDTYSRIYGVLGALFMGLLWNWLAWFLILAGAVLAFVLQNYEHLAGREQRKLLGERFQIWNGVRVLLTVYRADDQGRTPIAVSDVAKDMEMAVYLADRLADTLAAEGLLAQSGSSHWEHLSVARPAAEITVADVAAALAHHTLGVPDVSEAHDPSEHALHALLSDSRATLTDRLASTTLADLLAATPQNQKSEI